VTEKREIGQSGVDTSFWPVNIGERRAAVGRWGLTYKLCDNMGTALCCLRQPQPKN